MRKAIYLFFLVFISGSAIAKPGEVHNIQLSVDGQKIAEFKGFHIPQAFVYDNDKNKASLESFKKNVDSKAYVNKKIIFTQGQTTFPAIFTSWKEKKTINLSFFEDGMKKATFNILNVKPINMDINKTADTYDGQRYFPVANISFNLEAGSIKPQKNN